MEKEIKRSESEWKKFLGEERFNILRKAYTETPFTGSLLHNKDSGIYSCYACGNEIFNSNEKFDSGCGWPSFFEAIDKSKIIEKTDNSHGMIRTEVLCRNCNSHLGHFFNDGPKESRYCINSASLNFKKK